MPAQFTPGYIFEETEEVSPTKLNNLVDLATLTGLGVSEFGGGTAGILVYGSTAPPLERGKLWYDTNAGSEGLKFAWVSATNGSVSKWLYATPRRDTLVWTNTAVSMGMPLFIGRPGFRHIGNEFIVFDGSIFPMASSHQGASGADPMMVIPVEHASASRPVQCAWAGFVKGIFGNSPLTGGNRVHTRFDNPQQFRDDTIPSRGMTWGIQHLSTAAAVSDVPFTLWGFGPAYEDLSP